VGPVVSPAVRWIFWCSGCRRGGRLHLRNRAASACLTSPAGRWIFRRSGCSRAWGSGFLNLARVCSSRSYIPIVVPALSGATGATMGNLQGSAAPPACGQSLVARGFFEPFARALIGLHSLFLSDVTHTKWLRGSPYREAAPFWVGNVILQGSAAPPFWAKLRCARGVFQTPRARACIHTSLFLYALTDTPSLAWGGCNTLKPLTGFCMSLRIRPYRKRAKNLSTGCKSSGDLLAFGSGCPGGALDLLALRLSSCGRAVCSACLTSQAGALDLLTLPAPQA
jgi:hypothetical protein